VYERVAGRSVTEQQRIRHLLARPDPADQPVGAAPGTGSKEGEGDAPRQDAEAKDLGNEAWSPPTLEKDPGRLQTKSSYDVHEDEDILVWPEVSQGANLTEYSRRQLLMNSRGRSISDVNKVHAPSRRPTPQTLHRLLVAILPAVRALRLQRLSRCAPPATDLAGEPASPVERLLSWR
jgi:hypothetical protein